MKNSHMIGIIVLLSFLLALAGCGKKAVEPTPAVPAEPVVNDTTPEPVLPEEGPQSAGPDVTAEPPQETPAEEPVETPPVQEEVPAEEPAVENTTTLNAENYRVISLKDLKAYPEVTHVKVGTTVEWRNVNDKLQHIIGWNGQRQQGVKPEPILQGESWSYTFTKPATIKWFSTARPTIQGIIYVEE